MEEEERTQRGSIISHTDMRDMRDPRDPKIVFNFQGEIDFLKTFKQAEFYSTLQSKATTCSELPDMELTELDSKILQNILS